MTRLTTSVSPAVSIALDFAAVHAAWQRARRSKKPSTGQLAFERQWLQRVSELSHTLVTGHWHPRRAVCFMVTRPKVREIHAPDFSDRVVHHALVPKLEKYFEPRFIHDSYANRRGKGLHKAVAQAQRFSRQILDGTGCGKGWYLQLDVRDFFYSIHRPTLYQQLKGVLQQSLARNPEQQDHLLALQSFCHKLLYRPVRSVNLGSAQRCLISPRKQLRYASPGCGLPIGNLSSQFFANVYLDRLDQYAKHDLKIKRYIRYADDLLLFSETPMHLLQWQRDISDFLNCKLKLQIKPATAQPLANGIDFLGYRIYPHHCTVRKRVVAHCREKLHDWQKKYVCSRNGFWFIQAFPSALAELQAMLGSYWAHFAHAASFNLIRSLRQSFPWLDVLFDATSAQHGSLRPRWRQTSAVGLQEWLQQLRTDYSDAWLAAECGCRVWLSAPARHGGRLVRNLTPAQWQNQRRCLLADSQPFLELREQGWLRHGARRRIVATWHLQQGVT